MSKPAKQVIAEAVDATFMQRGFNAERHATAICDALAEYGYAIVPIQPSETMLEELARIGDGPMISGGEVWGYMLAAAMTAPTENQNDPLS